MIIAITIVIVAIMPSLTFSENCESTCLSLSRKCNDIWYHQHPLHPPPRHYHNLHLGYIHKISIWYQQHPFHLPHVIHRVWHLVSRLLCIETFLNFWEYRSRSRKFWSRKKVSVSVSKIFGLKKKSRSRKKVSVSVSMKFFGLVTQWLPHHVLS